MALTDEDRAILLSREEMTYEQAKEIVPELTLEQHEEMSSLARDVVRHIKSLTPEAREELIRNMYEEGEKPSKG